MQMIVNSQESLSKALGEIRSSWNRAKYLKLKITEGSSRSLSQNAISHAWYEQVARELREDDALGVKCYCKLHFGVPILRAEDDEYREVYDSSIKLMTYEQKLKAMHHWPVTSLMTKQQLSKYLEMVQAEFQKRAVFLEFPPEEAVAE